MSSPLFSQATLDFLVKAGKQKSPTWLERNDDEYQTVLRRPFVALAERLKVELEDEAPRYHFPTKGLGRIKRPDFKVAAGKSQYKDWVSLSAQRPSESRYESNPHLFLGIFPTEDELGPVVLASGLWEPSSPQLKKIRRAIAADASAYHALFADKAFKACFPKGFHLRDQSVRVPRGFDPTHPDVDWLRLKKFVVLKKFTAKEFSSKNFGDAVIKHYRQGLRLNRLLDEAIDAVSTNPEHAELERFQRWEEDF